jgi:hypothetical protein
MGNFKRTVQLIEQNVLSYADVKVVPRGTPIFPDLLMTGQMRFAKRLGANISVLKPDNAMVLVEDSPISTRIVTVDRTLDWLETNCLVSFNKTEMLEVQDWDPSTGTIILASDLSSARSTGEDLYLWATPLVLHANASQGTSTITVRSRYQLLNGDAISIPSGAEVSSLIQYSVQLAQAGGDSGDTEFPYLFSLTLATPLQKPANTGQTRVYLRAFPGYYSPSLRIPKHGDNPIGPFLVDIVASPLDSIQTYPEVVSLRTTTATGTAILGTPSSLATIARNTPVIERPIFSDSLIFWKIYRGSGGYSSPNRFRLITDEDGLAKVATDLVPAFPTGNTWSLKVAGSTGGILRVQQGDSFTDFTLVANQTQTVQFTTTAGSTFDQLAFLVNLQAVGEVSLSDLTLVNPVASLFQYGLVFQVLGSTNFQSTSLIVKPYFLNLSDLAARYDNNQTYNSGVIYS